MAKQVPVQLVKANQSGIVLSVLALLIFRQPWIVAALWAVQVAGLATEGKWNLFIQLAKRLLPVRRQGSQSAELLRFNNSLAVLFLSLSLLSFLLGWTAAAYTFSVMLLAAASAALMGYCMGCTVYYWVKKICRPK